MRHSHLERDQDSIDLLQRVITLRKPALWPLYWRNFRHPDDGAGPVEAELQADGAIRIAGGTTISFDTYFGSFFESFWWTHTRLRKVELRVVVAGDCRVRLLRRIGPACHLLEQVVSRNKAGECEHRLVVADESINFRQHGIVYFEISADPLASAAFERLVVVNQGRPELGAREPFAAAAVPLHERLTLIEQANGGGAGGFTRGLIEALDDPGLTHALLLDDDIDLEPETLVRMQSFLCHAHANVAAGGHMLDRVQPMRLYEAGGAVDEATWFVRPVQPDLDIARPETLSELATQPASHYNGWWCFAVPLAAVRRIGLPLPCFIRGDDVEYGIRLGRAGIPTVSVPGIAVWHEPFYLKLGGWHLYYETRNLLVVAALHRNFTAYAAGRRQMRHFLLHLLTYRYAGAVLILRAIEDFLSGPDVMRGDPLALHREIAGLAEREGPERIARSAVLSDAPTHAPPKFALLYAAWLVFVLLRNAARPARGEDRRLNVADFAWVTLRRMDRVVLDNWWEERMPAYRRSRARFLRISRRAFGVFLRLFREGPTAASRWREAAPTLYSLQSWRTQLAGARLKPEQTNAVPQAQDHSGHGTSAASRPGASS